MQEKIIHYINIDLKVFCTNKEPDLTYPVNNLTIFKSKVTCINCIKKIKNERNRN